MSRYLRFNLVQLRQVGVACLLAIICWSRPLPLNAATEPLITLTVTLHDLTGRPQADVGIRIVTDDTAATLEQGTTDAAGTVRFVGLTPREIRVVVEGQSPHGDAFKQLGEDATGIWVRLPRRDWTLLLVADEDGVVFPDLAMVAVDAAGPDVAAASSAAVGTAPKPLTTGSAAPSGVDVVTRVEPLDESQPGASTNSLWVGLSLAALLGGSIVLLLLARRHV